MFKDVCNCEFTNSFKLEQILWLTQFGATYVAGI